MTGRAGPNPEYIMPSGGFREARAEHLLGPGVHGYWNQVAPRRSAGRPAEF